MRGWWLCGVLLACGCNTTNTGNPFGDETTKNQDGHESGAATAVLGVPGQCEPVTKELAGSTSPTELGITAGDVLAFAAGEHATKIRWQDGGIATYAPESGEHALTLRVSARANKPRAISYKMSASTNGGKGTLDIAPLESDCSKFHALEIDVSIEVMSDGGALDERIDGTLVAASGLSATAHLELDAAKLGGGFKLLSTDPSGFMLKQLALELGFSQLGVRGALTGILEMRSSDSTSVGATTGGGTAVTNGGSGSGAIATIGDAAACDASGGYAIALDRKLQGFSGQDVLDAIAALPPLPASLGDGTSAQFGLSFAPNAGGACALLERIAYPEPIEAGSLQFAGKLRLKSEGARIDAQLPVTLLAVAGTDGGLQKIDFGFDSNGPIDAAALASYGFAQLDIASYDSVLVDLDLALDPGASTASGRFEVRGLKFAPCVMQPPPDQKPAPNSGSASSGCAGADLTSLVSIDW